MNISHNQLVKYLTSHFGQGLYEITRLSRLEYFIHHMPETTYTKIEETPLHSYDKPVRFFVDGFETREFSPHAVQSYIRVSFSANSDVFLMTALFGNRTRYNLADAVWNLVNAAPTNKELIMKTLFNVAANKRTDLQPAELVYEVHMGLCRIFDQVTHSTISQVVDGERDGHNGFPTLVTMDTSLDADMKTAMTSEGGLKKIEPYSFTELRPIFDVIDREND